MNYYVSDMMNFSVRNLMCCYVGKLMLYYVGKLMHCVLCWETDALFYLVRDTI
jgi:hypothetical protein